MIIVISEIALAKEGKNMELETMDKESILIMIVFAIFLSLFGIWTSLLLITDSFLKFAILFMCGFLFILKLKEQIMCR